MQKLQREYDALLSSAKDHNSFDRFLIESTTLEDSRCDLQASAQYYEELKKDNARKIQILLCEKMEEMIEGSRIMLVNSLFLFLKYRQSPWNVQLHFFYDYSRETRVMDQYNQEILHNPTLGFTAVPWHIQNELDKTLKQLEKLEALVESVKNKFKTMIVSMKCTEFQSNVDICEL